MSKDHTTGFVVGGLVVVAVVAFLYFGLNRVSTVSPTLRAPIAVTHSEPHLEEPEYETITASPDGIGKVYMGREISQVMGHPAIGWLERNEREQEEQVTAAIAALNLRPTDVIADIGAGSGYYTFRIAPLVPKGEVVAVDIQPEMIGFLTKKRDEESVTNVRAELGTIDDIGLAPESIDAALMVDAYHEFSHPAEMLRSIYFALKPGGKVYLLEYRAEDPDVPIKQLHKMSEAQAVKELEANGFTFLENRTDLPWQHLLVFEKIP